MKKSFAILFLLAAISWCIRVPASPATALKPEERDIGAVYSSGSVHVLVLGDFGQGTAGQVACARGISAYHAAHPFNIAITVGDNFYGSGATRELGGGVKSTSDPKWTARFENPYGPLHIPFFATLGNHDYLGSVGAELDKTAGNTAWHMPFTYYTFSAGPIRFFALDTALDSVGSSSAPTGAAGEAWKAEEKWLKAGLDHESGALWKVVYGHRPIYSTGWHGDTPFLKEDLLPILKKGKVDLFVAGHDHDLEHLTGQDMQFFISGGGGGHLRSERNRTDGNSLFFYRKHGFMDIIADANTMQVNLIDTAGNVLHTATYKRKE